MLLLPLALMGCTPEFTMSEPVSLVPGMGTAAAAPDEVGFDTEALARLGDYAFRRDGGEDTEREGQRTNALLIQADGRVVYERYARGYDADDPLLTWSVTKSLAATLIGAAVHEGLMDINEPACAYYEPMCRGGRDAVRVSDLLRMSSGLAWDETYETSPVFSSVMAMLYTRGAGDMALFAAQQPLEAAPGTVWEYSSGSTNILMAALRGAVGAERYPTYPWEVLFDPLGMSTAVLERDGSGTFVGSSYLYASPRDMALWGQLILQDGVWEGERILAEGWVRYLGTMAPAFYSTPVGREHYSDNPGAQWYLNLGDPDRDLPPPWPGMPADAMGASGHWGKYLWVVPSWNAVIVRMGDDRAYGCSYPLQGDCVEDTEAAFTKVLFTERLGEVFE